MKQNRKTIGNQQIKRQLWERNNEILQIFSQTEEEKKFIIKIGNEIGNLLDHLPGTTHIIKEGLRTIA